ncbi:carbohydrate ABC transporter permease [Culicoidibacter larvae]|uniref:Sugar ABC transporter permease n=1 Tax=Culicoidibacter larvae TaxID=2579976 RepID=A0A5R8QFJ8_9FIRM|nr:sugar ABC transporter permease [Culicoidibacter larvae]TLG75439.1 sugar ABC transporter permease [Culicoidibacter larvae]
MKKKKNISFWLFLAPALISFALIVIVPLIIGIYYSFTDWNGIGVPNFIGITNYAKALGDEDILAALLGTSATPGFWSAFFFTVKFTVVSVIVLNALGLGLALLVTQKMKTSSFLRTIFFMPNLIGGLILGFIWQFIFINIFSAIGSATGLTFFNSWLTDQHTGFWAMVILFSWQMAGYLMIIYIAALQNVPEDIIEAAKVDGASSVKRFRYIVVPMIMPAFTVSLFLALANSFKMFDQNLALTNGQAGTEMLALNIYKTAFTFNNFGQAQAKAVIFFILVAIITLIQVSLTKDKEVEV